MAGIAVWWSSWPLGRGVSEPALLGASRRNAAGRGRHTRSGDEIGPRTLPQAVDERGAVVPPRTEGRSRHPRFRAYPLR